MHLSRRFIDYVVPLLASVFLSTLTLFAPLLGVFWFPGFILAALAFPEGLHSEQFEYFIVLAAGINVFVYFWVFRIITAIVVHRFGGRDMIHH